MPLNDVISTKDKICRQAKVQDRLWKLSLYQKP